MLDTSANQIVLFFLLLLLFANKYIKHIQIHIDMSIAMTITLNKYIKNIQIHIDMSLTMNRMEKRVNTKMTKGTDKIYARMKFQ